MQNPKTHNYKYNFSLIAQTLSISQISQQPQQTTSKYSKHYTKPKKQSIFKQIYLHFCFIFLLCLVHLGFHFLDYQALILDERNLFENALILTSFDAYHYAKGAREILESSSLEILKNLHTFTRTLHPLSILGGMLAKLTGLDFALSFCSVIFSCFTIIALYLLTNATLNAIVKNDSKPTLKPNLKPLLTFLSFLASLIASLLPCFYQRVGAGYFDTDMLLLAFPLLLFYFLIQYEKQEKFSHLAMLGLCGYCAVLWHNGIQNLLLFGFLLFVILELIFALKTREIPRKTLALICVFLIILTPSPFCLAFLIAFLATFRYLSKSIWILLILSILYALFFGLFNPLFSQIQAYFFGSTQHSNSFIFYPVTKAILETMPISLESLILRSGGILNFTLGSLGFLIFALFNALLLISRLKANAHKRLESLYLLLFLLPFCALGILSLKIGARFSLFLMPIIAIGFSILALWILAKVKKLTPILIALSLYVSIFIANLSYQVPPPILSQQEIKAFKELDSNLTKNDFIFSWWDYGYALRYFTKAQILLDGGRHSGAVNYPIAKILLDDSPTLFYNFSMLLANSLQKLPQNSWNRVFENALKDSNFKDLEEFFTYLSTAKPQNTLKDSNIYWVLPLRILPLLANINLFTSINAKPSQKEFFAFLDSKNVLNTEIAQTKIARIIDIYKHFYATSTNGKHERQTLTQINFGKNSLLLSDYYLKSNIIQIMLFSNYPSGISASGDIVRVLQLKGE